MNIYGCTYHLFIKLIQLFIFIESYKTLCLCISVFHYKLNA